MNIIARIILIADMLLAIFIVFPIEFIFYSIRWILIGKPFNKLLIEKIIETRL